VYGNRGGAVCDEQQPLDPCTPHARLKAHAKTMLAASPLTWCAQRLGALYGIDDRRARTDRVAKWVTAAATTGQVQVPDPDHWRGWLHRDQAARALWRAARDHTTSVVNVSTADLTFGQAANLAAELTTPANASPARAAT
jgi:nucleoside-diphosphate-sugar epimerase